MLGLLGLWASLISYSGPNTWLRKLYLFPLSGWMNTLILSYAADFWNGDGGGAFPDKPYGETGDENWSEKSKTKCRNNGSIKQSYFGMLYISRVMWKSELSVVLRTNVQWQADRLDSADRRAGAETFSRPLVGKCGLRQITEWYMEEGKDRTSRHSGWVPAVHRDTNGFGDGNLTQIQDSGSCAGAWGQLRVPFLLFHRNIWKYNKQIKMEKKQFHSRKFEVIWAVNIPVTIPRTWSRGRMFPPNADTSLPNSATSRPKRS